MESLDPKISEPVITLSVIAGLVIAVRLAVAAARFARARAAGPVADAGGRQGRDDLLYEIWQVFRDPFLLFSWRGSSRTGLRRAGTIAANTVREAVRKKILWVVPVWFATVMGVGAFLKPFDETQDTYGLMTKLLLFSQLVVAIGTVSLLAVADIGNERRRKTLFTLMVKPVTRLELVLGKTVGHSMTALLLTAMMAGPTYAFFLWQDSRIRREAAARYEAESKAYAADPTQPPPEVGLKVIADEGVLSVQHVLFPAGPVQIYNREAPSTLFGRTVRFVRTGAGQKAIATFAAILPSDGLEPPRVRARFAGMSIPHLLRRDHGKRITADGRLQLPVKFTCIFSPGGDFKRAVSVTYPLEVTDDLRDQLSQKEQERLLSIRQNTVNLFPNDPVREFPLTAEFPVPNSVMDVGPVEVQVTCDTFGMYAGIHPAESLFITGVSPEVPGVGSDRILRPMDGIGILGNKFRNRPSIMGISPEDDPYEPGPKRTLLYSPDRAVWRFPGLTPDLLDAGRPAQLRIKMLVDVNDNAFTETAVRVSLVTADGLTRHDEDAIVGEGRPLLMSLPDKMLSGKPFQATLTSRVTGHSLGLDIASVRIAIAHEPFWLALAKAESVVWMQATLLAAIGLWAGTFLTWSVALLIIVFVLIIGLFKTVLLPLGVGHELFRLLNVVESFQMDKLTLFETILKWLIFGLGHLIALSGFLAPNLRDFNEFELLSRGVAMNWGILLADLGSLLLYAVPFTAGGYVVMRWKEAGE